MSSVMEQSNSKIYQVITKLLDGRSRTLNFETPVITISSIKARIENLTSIPIPHQLLISNGKILSDDGLLYHGDSTVQLLLRLRGGKGGFGSLLRGAATKAGQKKTNNFDACRDMSGRRLRHANAEKKMEEWLAEESERKLEKVAEEFIKKTAKAVKKAGGDGSEKYVDKYRKDSAKCMEDVDKSVRESLAGGFLKSKRKVAGVEVEDGSASKSKKLKIWMGKRKVDDSDSDDMDEEDSEDEAREENEKFVVTNNESESNKESNGSIASVTGGNKIEGECSVGCSSESASDEDKETVKEGQLGSLKNNILPCHEESTPKNLNDSVSLEIDNLTKPETGGSEGKHCELPNNVNDQKVVTADLEAKDVIDKEEVSTKSDSSEFAKALNFDEFDSASKMEVLGMERLKSELQERGLKCGGTLQERAARLFLLKKTPLEKLPKKLLAKK